MADKSKSLQELENADWGEPSYPTGLVSRCHELRRVPLQDLSVEDCSLLLRQRIGAPYLVPLALEFLHENPLEGGGALLETILKLKAPFWKQHTELLWKAKEVLFEIESLRKAIEYLAPAMREFEHSENWLLGIKTPLS